MTSEAAAKKNTQKLQRAIVDGLEDVKAQDIQVFDTEHLSPLFERVIVASGTSNRQTKALAASVRDAVRDAGFAKPRVEGETNGEWIIVDCGSAVAHIMQPAIRQYYHLEEIWGEKPVRTRIGAARPAAARQPADAEEHAPAAGAAGKSPSLRRSSAAKTAVRAAEKAAKAEKAEQAKTSTRKTAASGSAARGTSRAKPPAKTVVVAPAAGRKTAPGRSAKSAAGKAPAKTAAKAVSRAPAKTAAKAASKAPAKTTARTPARTTGRSAAAKAPAAAGGGTARKSATRRA